MLTDNTLALHAWENRLAPIVARKLKLNSGVTFRGFTRADKFGAVTPIFTVPASHRAQAETLGLLIA